MQALDEQRQRLRAAAQSGREYVAWLEVRVGVRAGVRVGSGLGLGSGLGFGSELGLGCSRAGSTSRGSRRSLLTLTLTLSPPP